MPPNFIVSGLELVFEFETVLLFELELEYLVLVLVLVLKRTSGSIYERVVMYDSD